MLHIYPIVEGHGEERALPLLLRRFFETRHQYFELNIFPAYRIPKDRMEQDLPKAIRLAKLRILAALDEGVDRALILLMRDVDDDCPVTLKSRFDGLVPPDMHPIRFEFVAPVTEFEAWFLEQRQHFATHPDCKDPMPNVTDIEQIRGAKQYFERNILRDGRYYQETVDQQKFCCLMNFAGDKNLMSRSLRRLTEVLDSMHI